MTVGVGDVDNCFHRMRIRTDLAEYFALGEMTAEETGLTSQEGAPLGDVEGEILLEAPGVEADGDVVGERVVAGEIEVDEA